MRSRAATSNGCVGSLTCSAACDLTASERAHGRWRTTASSAKR
jgi:hypothetical protein